MGSGHGALFIMQPRHRQPTCLLTWVSAFDLLVQFTVVFY